MKNVHKLLVVAIVLIGLIGFTPAASAGVVVKTLYVEGQYDELVQWIFTWENGIERVQLRHEIAEQIKGTAGSACGASWTSDALEIVGNGADRLMNKLLLAKTQNSKIRLSFRAHGTDNELCRLFSMLLHTDP